MLISEILFTDKCIFARCLKCVKLPCWNIIRLDIMRMSKRKGLSAYPSLGVKHVVANSKDQMKEKGKYFGNPFTAIMLKVCTL